MGTSSLYFKPIIGIQLLSFFYLGKLVTKYGKKEKLLIENDFSEKRDVFQVLANGGVSWVLILWDQFGPNIFGPLKINENTLILTSLASFSACLGDTFSSELGILAESKPRLITNPFKIVPKGTNGGVTLNGLIASILGGSSLGIITFVFNLSFFSHQLNYPKILFISSTSGLLGSLIDSYLGAIFEYSGIDKKSKKVTNLKSRGEKVPIVENFGILSGNGVNFLSSVLTAFIAYSCFL